MAIINKSDKLVTTGQLEQTKRWETYTMNSQLATMASRLTFLTAFISAVVVDWRTSYW